MHGSSLMFVTVYHFECPIDGPILHAYRTREGIAAKNCKVLEDTARQVPGYEVTAYGLWKPDRNPVV